MKQNLIEIKDNYVWYVEEIFGGRHVAKEGIYLCSYHDFKGMPTAIVTATESIDSLVVRHIPEDKVFSNRIAALAYAAILDDKGAI